MQTNENPDYKAIRAKLIADNALTIESVFVPFSQSRNKGDKDKSLNWRVTLKRAEREILTTDYSAGIGHCPSYNQGARMTIDYAAAIAHECEKGTAARQNSFGTTHGKPIKPDSESVLWSLIRDSDVLDYSGFEDWAACMGYDTDSRKGEKIYQECMGIALKLRYGLGESLLADLREAYQDY